MCSILFFFFFFQAEDGIRDDLVTGVQTCALPIFRTGQQETPPFLGRPVPWVFGKWSGDRAMRRPLAPRRYRIALSSFSVRIIMVPCFSPQSGQVEYRFASALARCAEWVWSSARQQHLEWEPVLRGQIVLFDYLPPIAIGVQLPGREGFRCRRRSHRPQLTGRLVPLSRRCF